MADEITEFEEIDPDEIHLVGTPASKFAALMAKSTEGKKGKKVKKNKMLKKMEKAARQAYPSVSSAHLNGVNLAGAGSTIASPGAASRIVSSFLAGFEDRVRKARGDVASAENSGNAMERDRAKQGLRTAQRQRLLAKMIVKENVVAKSGGSDSPFGAAIFSSSSYTLDDDSDLGYVAHGGGAVR